VKRAALGTILALVMTLALVGPAMPTTAASTEDIIIDFDSAVSGPITTSYSEDGFVLTPIGYGDATTIVDVGGNKVLKDSGQDNAYGAEVYIRSANGNSFIFNSLDYNNPESYTSHSLSFRYIRADASSYSSWVNLYLTGAGIVTASTLGVDAVPLSQLNINIVSYGADYSVDNINLTKLPGKYYSGHYYKVINTGSAITWTDARDAAAAMDPIVLGGNTYWPHLATITSDGEQTFLEGLSGADTYLWLGGYQEPGLSEPAGGWTWITGESFVYENWIVGEPNNNGGSENYLEWNAGGWNDANVDSGRVVGYIVEYENAVTVDKELTACYQTNDQAKTPVDPDTLLLGTEYTFEMTITINAAMALTDVIVVDGIGADLGNVVTDPWGIPTKAGKGKNGATKVTWTYAGMDASDGDVLLKITASTDINPAGKQEFTSPGEHVLNSGPVVSFTYAGCRYSVQGPPVMVTVVEPAP